MDSTSFTFLATVVVLVLLSASLVFRSYTLRRRYRQGFQQALADGLFADFDHSVFSGGPMGVYRRSGRRMGPKPVLWDTWVRPADKDATWSSITPVAVRRTPSLSPSTLILSRQPSTAPPGSPRSHQTQPWPPFFSQLRLPSRVSPPAAPSSPPPRQSHTPPAIAGIRSLPDLSGPPDLSARAEQDAATLAVCVLVAMPDVSAPVYHLASDIKGKGVDPLESQARQQSVPAGPSLPSPPHRSDPRTPGLGVDEEGLPILEFGVVEKRTGDWEWEHE